jgi:uncharacterized protein with von Willebrand factor type A (vWA) domain
MGSQDSLGGIIHTYQKFDPVNFPSPTAPPPDMVSPAFEHLLFYGSMRRLTDEELARAVHLDPRQFRGFGPSLEALMAILRERKRKILATYETAQVETEARVRFRRQAEEMRPPGKIAKEFHQAVKEEQLHELENLWYRAGGEQSPFARQLMRLVGSLAEKYQIDELAGKYEFTGHTPMTIPQALEIKEELETIDRLLKQLEDALQNGQIGVIDMEELSQFLEPGDLDQLTALQQQIQDYLREMAEQQGLEQSKHGYLMTPKAVRLFQSRLLTQIFDQLQASRSGRHQGPIIGEGATEMQRTKPYEFGDSATHMDIPASMVNAMLRDGPGLPVRLKPEDIEIHRTRNNPKCATAVLLDMSGSMRHGGEHVNVKRMGIALDGLIRTEYPGDFLQLIEMYTFAKPRHISEIPALMPKPVTLFDPVVRLRVDMSDPRNSELLVPPHFTNIQHALRLGRQFLAAQDTPNRQIVLITDGQPTAHFEGEKLFLLYPPDPRTEEATMREGLLCAREGITINIFLLNSWSQTEEDVRFAYRLAESTRGRVFFTAGRDLDRFVVWDYLKRRKQIIA